VNRFCTGLILSSKSDEEKFLNFFFYQGAPASRRVLAGPGGTRQGFPSGLASLGL
jgi:hypothetical protein